MEPRPTRLFESNELNAAATLLAAGGIVAFPTETVYGLGANAMAGDAVARIYEAKGRPANNPLIVHISDVKMLNTLAAEIPSAAQRLMDAFWPGPLTLLFPKTPLVPSIVTAGLPTVAVRMPNHPIALELIRLAGVPIVAPSANRSGRPSATTWQAVMEDLDGRIDGVICGPATEIGLESTVVDTTFSPVSILRHGAISTEMLQRIEPNLEECHQASDPNEPARSPGLMHRHYQPQATVRLVFPGEKNHPRDTNRAWIGIVGPNVDTDYRHVERCSSVEDYASRVFDFFRRMDQARIASIDCERVDPAGLGRALMDRLQRASANDSLLLDP